MWKIQPSGLYQRLIREAMRPFARQHGFAFLKRTLLGRVHEDTLHIINFDVINPGYICSFAIQPLYVPARFVVLNLNRRLEYRGPMPGGWGLGESEDEIRRELVQVQRLLETEALPWFAEVGTPGGIVSFIETSVRKRKPIWGLTAFWHDVYLGFSYLYIGRYEAGQRALASAAETLSKDTRPPLIEHTQLVDRMRAVARDEPERVPLMLQEFVRETKANLRLK